MTIQLFAFFADHEIHSVAEGFVNAVSEENYLLRQFNHLEVISVIGKDFDECWKGIDLVCDTKLIEYTVGFINGMN